MLVTQLPVFLQSLVDDVFQLWREVRVQADCGTWITIQNFAKDNSRAFSAKGQCAGRHLVEDCPERKQIRASVQLLGSYLFRRHIGNGSQSRSRTGQVL